MKPYNSFAAHKRGIFYESCFPTIEDLAIITGAKVISEEQWAGHVQSVKKQIQKEMLYTLE